MFFSNYSRKDCRVYLAPCYYICLTLCKQEITKGVKVWKDLEFENFMWIITKANIHHMLKYYDLIVPYDFLSFYEDSYFVPNTFHTDWQANYILNKNGTIKMKNNKPIIKERCYEYTWEDYISPAAFEDLNRAILEWKIYGRFVVKIFVVYLTLKNSIICKLDNTFHKNTKN